MCDAGTLNRGLYVQTAFAMYCTKIIETFANSASVRQLLGRSMKNSSQKFRPARNEKQFTIAVELVHGMVDRFLLNRFE